MQNIELNLCALTFLAYSSFGVFIGLLLGRDRPTKKSGYKTYSVLATLIAFAGGSVVYCQALSGAGAAVVSYFYYFNIALVGFSLGGVIAYCYGKGEMENKIHQQERDHAEKKLELELAIKKEMTAQERYKLKQEMVKQKQVDSAKTKEDASRNI